jgi:hypothetical protein
MMSLGGIMETILTVTTVIGWTLLGVSFTRTAVAAKNVTPAWLVRRLGGGQ